MTYIIPPSLKWLIDKHARISGEIIVIEKKLSKVSHLLTELTKLKKDLESVATALNLHEINVDVENIKPIRPHRPNRVPLKFRRGEINNLIMKYMISRYGGAYVTKAEIIDHIRKKHFEIDSTPIPYKQLARLSSQVLSRLYRAKKVIRQHNPVTSKFGSWELSAESLKYRNDIKLKS